MSQQVKKQQTPLNAEEFDIQSQALFGKYLNKDYLKQAVLKIPDNNQLFLMCEHYDILDKLVLHDDKDIGIRVRLHVFANDYFDRPHDHRWTYSSYILSGGYKHIIYGIKRNVECPEFDDLIPVQIRHEKKGDSYTLHCSQYHSVIAKPETVSLIIRGPSHKDKFRLIDRITKNSWWQYGTSVESEEEKLKKRMTEKRFYFLVDKLTNLGII